MGRVCDRPSLQWAEFSSYLTYLQTCFDSVGLQYKKLDCLMYADDNVIISTSANGLQQKLKLLEKYCSYWCMKVNIKKTKSFNI